MATMSNTQHNAAKVKYGIRHLGLAAFGCKSHKEQSMAKANMMYDRIIITSKRIYLEVRLRELSGAYFQRVGVHYQQQLFHICVFLGRNVGFIDFGNLAVEVIKEGFFCSCV